MRLLLHSPNILIAAGAGAAVQEISDDAVALQLCEKCQMTLDRLKRHSAGNDNKVAKAVMKTSERVNRVLMFMSNYQSRKDVILTGLNALMYFSQNGKYLIYIYFSKLCDLLTQQTIK
jgi:hypothetical protein